MAELKQRPGELKLDFKVRKDAARWKEDEAEAKANAVVPKKTYGSKKTKG